MSEILRHEEVEVVSGVWVIASVGTWWAASYIIWANTNWQVWAVVSGLHGLSLFFERVYRKGML